MNLETQEKRTRLLLTDIVWIFQHFCVRVFTLFSVKMKIKLPYSRKFSYNIVNLSIICFKLDLNYNPDWLKWISRRFLRNDKLFDLENYFLKIIISGGNLMRSDFDHSNLFFFYNQYSVNIEHQLKSKLVRPVFYIW